jgi:hypothetical protein
MIAWLSKKFHRWHLWNLKTFRRRTPEGYRRLDTAWDRYWWRDSVGHLREFDPIEADAGLRAAMRRTK